MVYGTQLTINKRVYKLIYNVRVPHIVIHGIADPKPTHTIEVHGFSRCC
jgi:hypothetical protein